MRPRLQDSTHYERTQQILRKYDPEYAKAQAREREVARREVAQAARPPSTPSHALVRLYVILLQLALRMKPGTSALLDRLLQPALLCRSTERAD